jgi:hypothetical protein
MLYSELKDSTYYTLLFDVSNPKADKRKKDDIYFSPVIHKGTIFYVEKYIVDKDTFIFQLYHVDKFKITRNHSNIFNNPSIDGTTGMILLPYLQEMPENSLNVKLILGLLEENYIEEKHILSYLLNCKMITPNTLLLINKFILEKKGDETEDVYEELAEAKFMLNR